MYKSIAKFCFFSGLTIMSAATSFAQSAEQTPTNAHLFLGTVAKQYTVNTYPGIDVGATLFTLYRLEDVIGESECKSRLVGAVDTFSGQDATGYYSSGTARYPSNEHENLPRLESALQLYSLKGLPYTVDWSKVASVKQSARHKSEAVPNMGVFPTKSVVQLVTADTNFAFVFPSEELASRVAYAMEFLRVHCDQTTQTGF